MDSGFPRGSLSSITEHSFQGITPSQKKGESVSCVSGTIRHLCVGSRIAFSMMDLSATGGAHEHQTQAASQSTSDCASGSPFVPGDFPRRGCESRCGVSKPPDGKRFPQGLYACERGHAGYAFGLRIFRS